MKDKCKVNGNKLEACDFLVRALTFGNPSRSSKGIFIPYRVNNRTGERGTDVVQIHSGDFVGAGIAANFCPFCGASIVTWGENHG